MARRQNRTGRRAATPRTRLTASDIAPAILASNSFAKDRSGRLYVYRDGVFVPEGEETVRALYLQHLTNVRRSREWTKNKANEVVEWMRITARELPATPSSEVINVKNGLLDLRTLVLREHTPEHLSTLQIPVNYDPAAKCPKWDSFIGRVLPGCESLFSEIVGYTIVPDSLVQKLILLWGPGGNGKSTLLRAMEALLGRNNVSNISLQELASDRFASADLYGKLANICGDLPATPIRDTGLLKALTGGDEISAQFKFKNRFKFRSFAKLVFSANQLPKFEDKSDGFWDRLLIIPMETRVRFTAGEKPQEELLSALREPRELSGALNKALAGYKRLTEAKRFSESQRSRELLDKLRGALSPLEQFLRAETLEVSAGQVEPQVLCERFNAWAREKGYPEKTPVQLGIELSALRPKIRKVRRGPKGKQKYVYEGLELKNAGLDPSPPRR